MELNESKLFDGLNDSQKQAVTLTDRPLLVVAGPGAGKTLTIVRRIAYLVYKGVRPENILAVTFTNRAARELKERAEALLGQAASRIFIGTFHLLGLKIIRDNSNDDFTIYSRDEQNELLKSLMKDSAKKARDAGERISRIKNYLEVADGDIAEVLDAYQSALKQRDACDFDDLIRVPIELLQDTSLAGKYQGRFKYIIVDEYQDINPAQYRLLRLLTGENDNVCVVGDPDQAIYAFRGADIENVLNFERDFPSAARVTLTRNYRSSGAIVLGSASVIRNNRKRIDKELAATREQGASINSISVPDERSEGALIIGEIEARMGGTSHYRMMQDGGLRPDRFERSYRFSDFAVIYRTNAQARALEECFAESGIPFQVIGKRSSAQRREIEETMAFLQSLIHPDGIIDPSHDDKNANETKLLTQADFFDPRADSVTLMTMHMAKGLEFPVVFITGCEDGLVPCTIMKDGADIEEERRLFYVGMTRAKDELFLLQARKRFLYGQSLKQELSPFVSEVPEQLKKTSSMADKIKKQKPEDKQMGLF